MGAETFRVSSDTVSPRAAFAELVKNARHQSGNRGYTGTIAEKDSYVIHRPPADVTPEVLVEALESYPAPSWVPEQLVTAYDDKWGPAIAIQMTDGSWTFMGWASS